MTIRTFKDAGLDPHAGYFEARVLKDPRDLAEAGRIRYQVYCLERGLLPAADYRDGIEQDEFDPCSIHIAAFLRESGTMAGTVRLVCRADEVLPMENHCSFLQGRQPAERRGMVAEISRLAIAPAFRRRRSDDVYGDAAEREAMPRVPERRAGHPEIVLNLYRALYQESRRLRISHLYAAMEPRLFRVFLHYGICFDRVGPLTDYYGAVAPYAASLRTLERRLRQFNPLLMAEFRHGLAKGRGRDRLAA